MLNIMHEAVKKIIIEGVTENGRKFRPSDWAERMSGALSYFGRDHRIQYSPMLQPLTVNGIKCVSNKSEYLVAAVYTQGKALGATERIDYSKYHSRVILSR